MAIKEPSLKDLLMSDAGSLPNEISKLSLNTLKKYIGQMTAKHPVDKSKFNQVKHKTCFNKRNVVSDVRTFFGCYTGRLKREEQVPEDALRYYLEIQILCRQTDNSQNASHQNQQHQHSGSKSSHHSGGQNSKQHNAHQGHSTTLKSAASSSNTAKLKGSNNTSHKPQPKSSQNNSKAHVNRPMFQSVPSNSISESDSHTDSHKKHAGSTPKFSHAQSGSMGGNFSLHQSHERNDSFSGSKDSLDLNLNPMSGKNSKSSGKGNHHQI